MATQKQETLSIFFPHIELGHSSLITIPAFCLITLCANTAELILGELTKLALASCLSAYSKLSLPAYLRSAYGSS